MRIDFDADLVELIAKQVAALSKDINSEDSIDKAVLHRISALQESKPRSMSLRENIFDRQRVLSGILRTERFPNDIYPRLQLMIKDVNSLINHADFSFQRLDYIQDAALGLINIEQNEIVKIFSVAAVIFMPATLIASIYGMNFKFMPELDWTPDALQRLEHSAGLYLRHRPDDLLFCADHLVLQVQEVALKTRPLCGRAPAFPLLHQPHETGVAYVAGVPVRYQKCVVVETVEVERGDVYIPCRSSRIGPFVDPVYRSEIGIYGIEHRAVMNVRRGVERASVGIAQHAAFAALLRAVLAPSVPGSPDREEEVRTLSA